MTFLLELRDTAKECADVRTRNALRKSADNLASALAALAKSPTRENMEDVNGRWAFAERVLRVANEGKDDGPRGGALRDAAELQRAA